MPTTRLYKSLLFFLAGLCVMILVFYNQDTGALFNHLKHVKLGWIGLAMLAGLIAHYLRGWRWNLLLEPMGYFPSNRVSFYAILIGYLVSYGIPRAGEISRCAVLRKTNGIPVDKSVGTVVTERLSDMVMLLLILCFALIGWFSLVMDYLNPLLAKIPASIQYIVLIGGIAVMIGGFGFVLWAIRQPEHTTPSNKFIALLKGFATGLSSILKLRKPWLFFALSLGIWALYFGMMFFSLKALDQTSQLGLGAAFLILALGTIGTALPIPGGLGFIPAVAQTFVLLGVSYDTGLVYGTAVQGAQLLVFIVTGSLSFVATAAIKSPPNESIS